MILILISIILIQNDISVASIVYISIFLNLHFWDNEVKQQVFFKPNNRLQIDLSSYLELATENKEYPIGHNIVDIYNQKLNNRFSNISEFAGLYQPKENIQSFFIRLSQVPNLNKALQDKNQIKYLDYLFFKHYNCHRFTDPSMETSTCEQHMSHFKYEDKALIKKMFKEFYAE